MPLTSSTRPTSPTSAAAYFAKRRRRGLALGAAVLAAAAPPARIPVSTTVVICSFRRLPRTAATPVQVQNPTSPHAKLYHRRRSVERQFRFSRHRRPVACNRSLFQLLAVAAAAAN